MTNWECKFCLYWYC